MTVVADPGVAVAFVVAQQLHVASVAPSFVAGGEENEINFRQHQPHVHFFFVQ